MGIISPRPLKLIAAAADEAKRAKIAALLLPGVGTVTDLKRAQDAGITVVRVATHCTEADTSYQHFGAARDLGLETVGFLMLSHRVSPEKLAEQALRWRPRVAVIEQESLLGELRERLTGSGIACAGGARAIEDAAAMGADWVMSAIVGAAGLAPTLAAARTGSVIALANKESLVCAGPALLEAALWCDRRH